MKMFLRGEKSKKGSEVEPERTSTTNSRSFRGDVVVDGREYDVKVIITRRQQRR